MSAFLVLAVLPGRGGTGAALQVVVFSGLGVVLLALGVVAVMFGDRLVQRGETTALTLDRRLAWFGSIAVAAWMLDSTAPGFVWVRWVSVMGVALALSCVFAVSRWATPTRTLVTDVLVAVINGITLGWIVYWGDVVGSATGFGMTEWLLSIQALVWLFVALSEVSVVWMVRAE